MRILGLYQDPDHVCFRYRLQAFRPFWEEAGHEVRFRGWPRWWLLDKSFFQDLKEADVVIVQRRSLTGRQLQRLRKAVRFLVYDFDDAVFLRDSYDPRGPESERRRSGFKHMVQAADLVVAGNDYLQTQAREWQDSDRVVKIPTCVNVPLYSRAQHAGGRKIAQLAWIGSSSTLQGLERIGGILELLGQKVTSLNLKIICDRSIHLTHLPIRFCPWSSATERRELAEADIGISWLPADDWSRGKCGLKILQYLAAGLPVVANPVGVQTDMVRPGETGFLVESADQWVRAVRQLVQEPDLRLRMGEQCRQLVEKHYHVSLGAAAWLELLKTLHPSAATALPLV